jgi:hypothetical protein
VTLHDLKSWPDYFQAVVNGRKRFEVRRDDRSYKEGDIVMLREFIPDEEAARAEAGKYDLLPADVKVGFTGRTAGPFRIGYLARGECMPDGCVAFELIKLVPGSQP